MKTSWKWQWTELLKHYKQPEPRKYTIIDLAMLMQIHINHPTMIIGVFKYRKMEWRMPLNTYTFLFHRKFSLLKILYTLVHLCEENFLQPLQLDYFDSNFTLHTQSIFFLTTITIVIYHFLREGE